MNDGEMTTLELIHSAAKAEFLSKGFKSASLRNIVKTAGVTTGAFYEYYSSKAELFEALASEAYNFVIDSYKAALREFADLPMEKQPEVMGSISQKCLDQVLDYMATHREEFLLLLQCSEGTRFASMTDELVELEVQATHDYYLVLQKLGYSAPDVDPTLEHILVTGMMNAYFEMAIHEMPLEKSKRYLKELHNFYTAGWRELMGT